MHTNKQSDICTIPQMEDMGRCIVWPNLVSRSVFHLDDNDDDEVLYIYSAGTPCHCSMLSALGRVVVRFEACYQ